MSVKRPSWLDRCSCTIAEFVGLDGTRVWSVKDHDPECREHGFPRDEWRLGAPLRKYARYVDKQEGELVTEDEMHERSAHPLGGWHWNPARFRLERPSEVEARLIAETRAA